MALRKRNPWAGRRAPAPWTHSELEELKAMSACGLACEFWNVALPGRGFGDIANKRLELREAGELILAPPL